LRRIVALLLVLAVAPAFADDASDRAAIDALFTELRVAPDEASAKRIDEQIWQHWVAPSDPALAQRMREVLTQRYTGNVMAAIRLLDQMVLDYPTYAEAWNQRATLYYAIGDYDHSLADCNRVLELEPRHFGALSGRSMMYLALGKRALALRDMAAALAVHPFLEGRRLFPELEHSITRI